MNLKIATYNIHHGFKLKKIVENIQKLSVDGVEIFCFQEMREISKKSPVLETCKKALGKSWKYEIFLDPDSYDFGLCIFWRSNIFKPKRIEKVILPEIPKSNIRVMVKKIRKTINRGALVITFEVDGELIRVSNLHLDCHGQFAQRERQLRTLVSFLESDSRPKKEIICGDFNTIGMEALSKNQEKKILDIFGRGFINVYPKRIITFRLLQRLDYIFVKNIKVRDAKVLRLKGSDHFPVVADLEI